MKNYRSAKAVLSALTLGFVGAALLGQSEAPTTEESRPTDQSKSVAQAGSAEEVFELSPFTVEGDATMGYLATTTLAGTRIKSELKDIGASISVYTEEFLEDTGAKSEEDLLVYTLGTEVTGVAGNYSRTTTPNSFQLDFGEERFEARATTRVRGLARADSTRDFFRSLIPMDSYIVQKVTVNRGANNILFGLGSPAGIIDTTLLRPMGRDFGEIEVQFDKYGSQRASLDLNRTFLSRKAKIRFIGLYDDKKLRQEPAGDLEKRVYGAIDLEPFSKTKIRINAETGNRSGTPPYLDPPRDKYYGLWNYEPKPFRPLGTSGRGLLSTDLMGSIGPGLFFSDGLTVDFATPTLPTTGGIGNAVIDPSDPLHKVVQNPKSYNPRMAAIEDPNRFSKDPLAAYSVTTQILDTSIFDYNNIAMGGPNDYKNMDYNAGNVALQQQFLNGDAGVEVAFDFQELGMETYDFQGNTGSFRARTITVDINEGLPDGTPNPNFGRPVAAMIPTWRELDQESKTFRATAFYRFDFAEKARGFLSRLGRHQVTMVHERNEFEAQRINGRGVAFSPEFGNAAGLDASANRYSGSLASPLLFYIGESVFDRESPSGTHLQGIRGLVTIPKQMEITYISKATRSFETSTFDLYSYPRDKMVLVSGAVWELSKTNSTAVSSQSMLFADHLVVTMGYRKDNLRRYEAEPAPENQYGTQLIESPDWKLNDVSSFDYTGETFSWNAVFHLPKFLVRPLPFGAEISLNYSNSENFNPAEVERSPLGGFFGPPTGKSEDYGITLSLLKGKIVNRLTWYKTTQANVSDTRLTSTYSNFFANVPKRVFDNNTLEEIQAANFVLPLPEVQEAYGWKWFTDEDGSPYFEFDYSAADIVDIVSKGFELETTINLTKNWRVSINAARQQAMRTGIAQTGGAEVVRLAESWINNPGIKDGTLAYSAGEEPTGWAHIIRQYYATFKKLTAEEGTKASQLREWRVNLITNYSFSESVLKGFSIGGALRWEGEVIIGYEYFNAGELDWLPDLEKPVYGPPETKVDAWIRYTKRISRRVTWTVQLNVRNLFNEDDLIPVFYNPDGSGNVYRLGSERTWFVTTGLKF
jgi:outer membrane receptor protein involved in Fe transport